MSKRIVLSFVAVLSPFALAGAVWAFTNITPAHAAQVQPSNVISVSATSAGHIIWLCDTTQTVGVEIKCTDGNSILISDEVRKTLILSTKRIWK